MTRRRWAGLAGSVVVAACVISAGATALAAAQGPHRTPSTHTNYQGPARTAQPAAAIRHQTNSRGPASTGAKAAAVDGSNVSKTLHQNVQRGSK